MKGEARDDHVVAVKEQRDRGKDSPAWRCVSNLALLPGGNGFMGPSGKWEPISAEKRQLGPTWLHASHGNAHSLDNADLHRELSVVILTVSR